MGLGPREGQNIESPGAGGTGNDEPHNTGAELIQVFWKKSINSTSEPSLQLHLRLF